MHVLGASLWHLLTSYEFWIVTVALGLVLNVVGGYLKDLFDTGTDWLRCRGENSSQDLALDAFLRQHGWLLQYFSADKDGAPVFRCRSLTLSRRFRFARTGAIVVGTHRPQGVASSPQVDFKYNGIWCLSGFVLTIDASCDKETAPFAERFIVQIDLASERAQEYCVVLTGLDYRRALRASAGIVSRRVFTRRELEYKLHRADMSVPHRLLIADNDIRLRAHMDQGLEMAGGAAPNSQAPDDGPEREHNAGRHATGDGR